MHHDLISQWESGAIIQVLRPDSTLNPETDPQLGDALVLRAYRQMVQARFIDGGLMALHRQGRIGFHIGCWGEEAAIVGAALALKDEDWIFPCYREFSAALLRGMPYQRLIDNYYGNGTDLAQGRQMPDHFTCKAAHITSVSSPVGTQINQAAGFAWACKLKGKTSATLVYFGEGAVSSSGFHSGLSFAGVYKAPVVFFCRNNGWAISLPFERQSGAKSVADKGVGYGIAAVRVDGNDLFAVYGAVRAAAQRARAGKGSTLVEAITYRMGGHSTSDDASVYRSEEEVLVWKARDPIEKVACYLKAKGLWNEEDEANLAAEQAQLFSEAVRRAEETPPPKLDTLFDDVYSELPWNLVEQRTQARKVGKSVAGED